VTQPLSTNPLPGTRDFFPEEMSIRQQVFDRLYRVVESYGYARYDGPMLEPMELYAAKSSEEIVAQQTYTLKDRGGRDLVVRPEMTPTVARMIAARSGSLALPARWYSHPNLWRYERKQRGRYREHWQVNVDLFGTESWEAEAEIFEILAEMMFALGAKTEDFELRVSDRGLLHSLLRDRIRVPEESWTAVFGVLDRLKKVPRDETRAALAEIGLDAEQIDTLLRCVAETVSFEEFCRALPAPVIEESRVARVMRDGLVTSQPVRLRFDPMIVRGFTYYTSSVFELFDTHPENPRSIAGGGRYDNLVGLFGAARVPGIGFGMGDVTLIDFLHTHGIAPRPLTAPDAIVLSPESGKRDLVKQVAADLRRGGLRAVTPLDPRKMGKQLERASREGIRFVVIIGSLEAEKGTAQLKDLVRSSQVEIAQGDLARRIREIRDTP
jgi:histidyl-tRNA synthetase